MANEQITLQRLRELLRCDPETGAFQWRLALPGHNRAVGSIDSTGRMRVTVDGVRYQASRLCWLFANGRWPVGVIDHINGDASDNRIANLRDVLPAINAQNRTAAQKNSKTQVLGVVSNGGKFRVAMSFRSKRLRVDSFDSAEVAHDFYLELKRRLHDGCTL